MGPCNGTDRLAARPLSSGGRTRTLNNWTRTSRVADYTTPERASSQVSRSTCAIASAQLTPDLGNLAGRDRPSSRPVAALPEGVQVVVPDDPPHADPDGLLQEVRHRRPPLDGGGLGGGGVRGEADVGGDGHGPVLVERVGDHQDGGGPSGLQLRGDVGQV